MVTTTTYNAVFIATRRVLIEGWPNTLLTKEEILFNFACGIYCQFHWLHTSYYRFRQPICYTRSLDATIAEKCFDVTLWGIWATEATSLCHKYNIKDAMSYHTKAKTIATT